MSNIKNTEWVEPTPNNYVLYINASPFISIYTNEKDSSIFYYSEFLNNLGITLDIPVYNDYTTQDIKNNFVEQLIEVMNGYIDSAYADLEFFTDVVNSLQKVSSDNTSK